MNSTFILSVKKVCFYIVIVCCSYTSCTKKESTIIEINPPQQSEEWQQETSLSEHLRLNTNVHEEDGKIFLLPGKGSSKYSSSPEILSFDGSDWLYEFKYTGKAIAGGSGYWQHGEFGYVVAGVNHSFVNTFQIKKINFSTQTITDEAPFPFYGLKVPTSCYTSSKGYFFSTFNNSIRPIFSYDFESSTWDSIAAPTNKIYKNAHLVSKSDSLFFISPTEADSNFFFLKEGTTQWTMLPNLPAAPRKYPILNQYKNYIVYGTGYNLEDWNMIHNDIWTFNLNTQEWSTIATYAGKPFQSGFSFVLNGRLFLGGGVTEKVISSESMNEEVWSIYLND